MARETVAANQEALELLELQPTDRVLEVGFGHGATIARMAAAVSRGLVAGVDPSPEMCQMATRRNRSAVACGRVALRQAAVEALPYPDAAFNKVLTVHTLYFWREPEGALSEIRRVLEAPGRLVLAWRYDPQALRSFPESVYRFHDEEGVRQLLGKVGFHSVEIVRRAHGPSLLLLAVASVGSATLRP